MAAGVPRPDKALGQLVQIKLCPHPDAGTAAIQRLGSHGALKQALHRRHQHGDLSPAQLIQQSQTLLFPLVRDGGGAVEGKGPGIEDGDGAPGEGA